MNTLKDENYQFHHMVDPDLLISLIFLVVYTTNAPGFRPSFASKTDK